MEITVDNLVKAVSVFYRSEANQQAEAHHWLTEAQNSPQAWSFVWELLDPHRSCEVQFFAATTLHTKIMKYWDEVPSDHYEDLKKRLLGAIVAYAMGPKLVLNRLCIALSAYIIHTVPLHWPNAFEELVTSFQPQFLPNVEPQRVIWILLEILTVIPEEFNTTPLATNVRARARTVFQGVSKDILKVSEMCLLPIPDAGFHMAHLTTYFNATRCACSWICLGGLNIEDCNRLFSLLVDLVCFVYWNKDDPEGLMAEEIDFFEVAVDALTRIIQHQMSFKYENLLTKHSSDMLYKFEKILEAERTGIDPNKDILAIIYGLIIGTADTHSKLLIKHLKSPVTEEQKLSVDFLISVLKCTDLPGFYPIDESASTLTFSFWYSLQDEILNLDTAECAQLLLTVKPYYRELVCVMLKKSMLPLSHDDKWSLDDREVFRCYRQDIADTFMYCYNVLNLEMLDILYSKLSGALPKENGSEVRWNEVETCLHAFGAIAQCIEMENLYLPKLMVLIKEIPFDKLHLKVMASALETIGAYSEWLQEHPEVLPNVMPLIISALSNPDVVMSATMALKDISHSCQKYIPPYAEMILVTCQNVIQSGLLKLVDHRRLMYTIGKVLSVVPVERSMEFLNVALSPAFEEINELANSGTSSSVTNSICTRLKILAALFNTLQVNDLPAGSEQPTLIIMRNTIPLFRIIADKFCTCPEVIEDLSCVLKNVITTITDESRPLIGEIMQLLITIYTKCPQSSILILTKILLILFGREEQFSSASQQLFRSTVETTVELCLQLNGCNQLSEKSDVFDAFFAMLAQILKKVPQLMYCSNLDLVKVFECAILCLVLPEIQALRSCSSFLVNFIIQSRETSQTGIIQTYGESLVLRILLTIGTTAPRTSVDVYSDILLALNKKYCDNLARWLHSLLAQEGFPSPRITAVQKNNFVKLVLKEKTNKKKICDYVLEFTLICRGILKFDSSAL